MKIPWNKFNPHTYIENNYSSIHDEDNLIIHRLVDHYLSLPKLKVALEIGVGPNLYPVMVMLPFVKKIECIDFSITNVIYLKKQLKKLANNWYQFWELMKSLNQKYKINLTENLKVKVKVKKGDIYKLSKNKYDISSMFFCAESITTEHDQFVSACKRFIKSVKPRGYLVAAFMENSQSYKVGNVEFPSYPVNTQLINKVFMTETNDIVIKQIPLAKQPLRPGYTGMILLTATRKLDSR